MFRFGTGVRDEREPPDDREATKEGQCPTNFSLSMRYKLKLVGHKTVGFISGRAGLI
jgi:hypothetical protein